MIDFRIVFRWLGAPLALLSCAAGVSAAPTPIFGLSNNGSALTPATPGNINEPGTPAWARSQFLGLLEVGSVRSEGFEAATVGATYQNGTGNNALTFSGNGMSVKASITPSLPLPPPSENNPVIPPLQNPGLVASTTSAGFAGRYNTTGGFTPDGNGGGTWAAGKWWEATGDFTISFEAGVNAFGFYLTDAYDFQGALRLLVDEDGDPSTPSVPLPPIVVDTPGSGGDGSLIFYGFTDASKSYKSITFDITQTGNIPRSYDVFGLDDMLFGALADPDGGGNIPEPATLALVAASLVGLAATRRRLR